jgi:glutamate--cysteine ligase
MEINSKDQIINYFLSGAKKNVFIGVENEKFLFQEKNNVRATYLDVKKVFEILIKKFEWKEVKENENIVGLKIDGKSISLEPGNQIELSGDKLSNIHEVCSESYDFQNQLDQICKEIGLKTMSIGYDPITKLSNAPKNPKQRYKLMTKEMPKGGKLSLNMMYQTSGTQINLDYLSEDDFKKKFKIISYLTPISIAIFANSTILENKPSGYLSYRSKVWQNTSRGGLPKIFLENMDFEKYADFAINFPLLFIYKNKEHKNLNNKTFGDFMKGSLSEVNNYLPTLEDLELHLSTIFTEIRLKKYIEMRSLDACEWDCHCAGPAFYTGLIYGKLDESLDLIKDWKSEDVLKAYLDAPKKGLKTEINGKSILEWGKILLNISNRGLIGRNFKNKTGNDETIFLKNIEQILQQNKTKAEKTLENFY